MSSMSAEVPGGENGMLVAVQSLADERAIRASRMLSHFGEHALGWMGTAALAAVLDEPRRRAWAGVGVGAFTAHAASVVLKRIVRRRRPHHDAVVVNVGTPSKLSFPSSHATSTTAWAVLAAHTLRSPLPLAVIPPMLVSRLILGVHYPTDVLAGAALGAATGCALIGAEKKLAGGTA